MTGYLRSRFVDRYAVQHPQGRNKGWLELRWYDDEVYAQKFRVELVIRGERRACPLEWLDQFCMRNFTNAAEFDDTLPIAKGEVEVSFRVAPDRFAESFGAWLTQRGKGEGQGVRVEISKLA